MQTATLYIPKIEKGVPIPISKNNPISRELLNKMEVGDSFFLPNEAYLNAPSTMVTTIHSWGRRTAKRYKTSYLDDGLRVWRTK